MTQPEVPEWRTRVHLTTEKSSGNKCTQRAGICVPDESTYALSIRKMMSPPREFTARAQSQRQREQTKRSPKWRTETRCKSKHEASQNTKQVNKQSESKKGQTKWKNEMKQAKRDEISQPGPAKRQAKSKTSKVQRRRIRNTASASKVTYRTGSPNVYRSS